MSVAPPMGPAPPGAAPARRKRVDLSIYKGRGQMGATLMQMLVEGRRVIAEERVRLLANRQMYLGNQYLAIGPTSVRSLAPSAMLKSGRRRDRVNRLRQFVDGRVALLSREVPPYEVLPPSLDDPDLASKRVSERYVRYEWDNHDGWNVGEFRRRTFLAGEQDGCVAGIAQYDIDGGPESETDIPVAPDPETGQWGPVTDRSVYEALKEQDPDAETLWRMMRMPLGVVRLRMVRIGRLAVDPLMIDDKRTCRWVIETDTWSIEKAEAVAGKRLADLKLASDRAGGRASTPLAPAVTVETGPGERQIPARRSVKVNEGYLIPQGPGSDWPVGGHIVWIDGLEGAPIVCEPWRKKIPYRFYTPRPDALEVLRSRGTVDELAPLQVMLNRTFSALGEWLDLVARPPLLINGGSLRTNRPVFNEDRIVEVNPGFTPPMFMSVPAEPVTVMRYQISLILEQMAEIAIQSDVSRGTPPGQGVESGVSLAYLGQANEQQMSGTEAEGKAFLEAVISDALYLVSEHYSVPRLVNLPGMDDEEAFAAFTGDKIRGCTSFRITGSVLPKNREAQRNALLALVQASGGKFDLTRYVVEWMAGNLDEIEERERRPEAKQQRELRQINALGRHQLRDQIWGLFTKLRDQYVQQAQMFIQAQAAQVAAITAKMPPPEPGMPPPPGPSLPSMEQVLGPPPTVTSLVKRLTAERDAFLASAQTMRVPGMPASDPSTMLPALPPLPTVIRDDPHARHILVVQDRTQQDGYDDLPEIVRQVMREHTEEHLNMLREQAQSMQAQTPAPPQPVPAPPAASNGSPSPGKKEPAKA